MQSFNRLMGMLVTMAAVSYTTLAEQPDASDKANAAHLHLAAASSSRAPNGAAPPADGLLKQYPALLRALEKRISQRRVLVDSIDPPVHDECDYAVPTDIEPEHALDEHSVASSRPRVDPAFRTADGAEVPAAGFGASCPAPPERRRSTITNCRLPCGASARLLLPVLSDYLGPVASTPPTALHARR